jgi:hypothetical protein
LLVRFHGALDSRACQTRSKPAQDVRKARPCVQKSEALAWSVMEREQIRTNVARTLLGILRERHPDASFRVAREGEGPDGCDLATLPGKVCGSLTAPTDVDAVLNCSAARPDEDRIDDSRLL